MDTFEEKCATTVKMLCEKYKNVEYMMERMDMHINVVLEKTLFAEHTAYTMKQARASNLETEQSNFVKMFLSKNRYYYLSQNNTECFYEYDGKHYVVVKKDDIIQKLLVTMSHNKDLHDWKFKTTDIVMKHIKDRRLHHAVPESYTIQYVLKLLSPSIFVTRDAAKYFLTVLGDNILKKGRDHIYLTHGKSKSLLALLENYAYITIGHSHLIKNFVKYHETHAYTNCRMIYFNGERENDLNVNQSLDLFCVACHYSSRFGSGDEYIQKKATENLKTYTMFLKDQTQEQIVARFCDEMIDTVDDVHSTPSTYTLNWKDIHYLWKSYLSSMDLPNMDYFNTLKQLLIQKYDYVDEHDCFVNIASKHLPLVRDFIEFWEAHVVTDTDNELEVDELCVLFKTNSRHIDDAEAFKIVRHFFPDVDIRDNKFIMNISCTLWNKRDDISCAMGKLKEVYRAKSNGEVISFDDAYQFYCSEYNSKHVTSKRYFEKYLHEYIGTYVVYETFISSDWYYEVEL